MSVLHWPDPLPAYGSVRLRPYRDDDLDLVAELSADPYVPLIGSVPSPFTGQAVWPSSGVGTSD